MSVPPPTRCPRCRAAGQTCQYCVAAALARRDDSPSQQEQLSRYLRSITGQQQLDVQRLYQQRPPPGTAYGYTDRSVADNLVAGATSNQLPSTYPYPTSITLPGHAAVGPGPLPRRQHMGGIAPTVPTPGQVLASRQYFDPAPANVPPPPQAQQPSGQSPQGQARRQPLRSITGTSATNVGRRRSSGNRDGDEDNDGNW